MAIRILQTLKENFQGINRKIPDFLVGFSKLEWSAISGDLVIPRRSYARSFIKTPQKEGGLRQIPPFLPRRTALRNVRVDTKTNPKWPLNCAVHKQQFSRISSTSFKSLPLKGSRYKIVGNLSRDPQAVPNHICH